MAKTVKHLYPFAVLGVVAAGLSLGISISAKKPKIALVAG